MIQRLYVWLGKFLGNQYTQLPQVPESVLQEALKLVEIYRSYQSMAGEVKRDRVFKGLAKQFPDTPRCIFSLAVELAYWNRCK